jgi:hypothetical protein
MLVRLMGAKEVKKIKCCLRARIQIRVSIRVADPGSGYPVPFWPLDPRWVKDADPRLYFWG